MNGAPSSAIHLDARLSPALEVPPGLLAVARPPRGWLNRRESLAQHLLYDDALRWLMVSDRLVSDQAARALLEVREKRLYVKEGHARWSTYLRAFVPMTSRWCQQEMRRVRALRDYPSLAAAWVAGVLSKSHLRIVLRAVTRETEEAWLQRASGATVRELEELATSERQAREGEGQRGVEAGASAPHAVRGDAGGACGEGAEEQAVGGTATPEPENPEDPEDAQPTRRVVMAPPGVAVLVSEAVELARKMASYQIGIGAAVEMMAMETLAGLNECPPSSDWLEADPPSPAEAENQTGQACAEDAHDESHGAAACGRRNLSLGDHQDLRREMGAGWERIHRQMEVSTGRWRDLPSELREVLIHGAPAEDSGAHERVVFWTGLQGRLDAVRGRLLRIVGEGSMHSLLGFAGFGQYARERMGLSLREAHELVRLDKALDRLPVAFRMYASGRLGRRAAWLLSRVASSKTDRAWTRFAKTHTLRLLEAVVEGALLKRETDPEGWKRDGGLPPQDAFFAGALRACSLLSGIGPGGDATARVEFLLDPEQRACYEATLERLRDVGGRDRPEWWGLAVMARHFLNCYGHEDRLSSPTRLRRMFHRRIIERDNYTCRAPECLQRGGLEADHIQLRSQGGPTTMENMVSLCAADHRFMKHTARTLALSGEAPDRVTARMGTRAYLNDRLIDPAFAEEFLDEDPWAPAQDVALLDEDQQQQGRISTGNRAVSQ